MRCILLFIAIILMNGCLTFKGTYNDDLLTTVESKEKHFILDMEWPGEITVNRMVCGLFDGENFSCKVLGIEDALPPQMEAPMEYRVFDLLNFTRVLTLLEQRNISIDNSKNLMIEYKLSIDRFNALINSHNKMVKETNNKEFNNVVLSWTSTGSIILNIFLILIIAL